jgi:hypothetical protein
MHSSTPYNITILSFFTACIFVQIEAQVAQVAAYLRKKIIYRLHMIYPNCKIRLNELNTFLSAFFSLCEPKCIFNKGKNYSILYYMANVHQFLLKDIQSEESVSQRGPFWRSRKN